MRHLVREDEARKKAGKGEGKRVEGREHLSLCLISAAWVLFARERRKDHQGLSNARIEE